MYEVWVSVIHQNTKSIHSDTLFVYQDTLKCASEASVYQNKHWSVVYRPRRTMTYSLPSPGLQLIHLSTLVPPSIIVEGDILDPWQLTSPLPQGALRLPQDYPWIVYCSLTFCFYRYLFTGQWKENSSMVYINFIIMHFLFQRCSHFITNKIRDAIRSNLKIARNSSVGYFRISDLDPWKLTYKQW